VLDNYHTHKHAEIDAWLAKNPRATIHAFIDGWNDRCHPFTWTKTADEILPHAIRKQDSDAAH
jgi:hypothetical protein